MATARSPRRNVCAPTYKHTYGFHPTLAALVNSGESLAAFLRVGNAGANTAADHISVLDAALAQIPDVHRHGAPILIRAETAGVLAHVAALRGCGVAAEFSIGWRTDGLHEVIRAAPKAAGSRRSTPTGEPVASAQVAGLTGLVPAGMRADYPAGMRGDRAPRTAAPRCAAEPVRRADDWRYTAFAPPTQVGQLEHLYGIVRTPVSRIASASPKTAACAASPRTVSRSTPHG